MWLLCVLAVAWADDETAEKDSPWNTSLSAGLPRLGGSNYGVDLDGAVGYQKRRFGFGAHLATATTAISTGNSISSNQRNVFDTQLRFTPDRPPEQFQLEVRLELSYEYIATSYIGANTSAEASSVRSFNVIAGGTLAEGGDWAGSVWGRLISQNELYVQIDSNSTFNAQSSIGWAGFGVFERELGGVSISSSTEGRTFRIRRLDLFTGGSGSQLEDVRILELQEQVGVWFNGVSWLGLRPGLYAGVEVNRAVGAEAVTGITPSIGASLVGDLIDAPSF